MVKRVKVAFLESGVARFTIDEVKRQQEDIELRHGSQARKERYNGAVARALVTHGELDKSSSGEASNKIQLSGMVPSSDTEL